MKIHSEVLAVETIGDALRVTLQGKAETDADWRPYLKAHIDVPETLPNRRAYYIGRKVTLTLKTR